MSDTTRVGRPAGDRAEAAGPLWPIYMAIGLLVGSTFGVVASTAPFPDPRPLWTARQWWALVESGWGQSVLVGMLALWLLLAAALLRRAAVRRLQLCLILSLVFHLWLAVFLHTQHLRVWLLARETEPDFLHEILPDRFPDYHWQGVDEPERVEEFERPVPAEPQESPLVTPPKPRVPPAPRPQPRPPDQDESAGHVLPQAPKPKRAELPPQDSVPPPMAAMLARQASQVRLEPSDAIAAPRLRPAVPALPPQPSAVSHATRQVPKAEVAPPPTPPPARLEAGLPVAELARRREEVQPSPEQVAPSAALARAAPAQPEPSLTEVAAPGPPASETAVPGALDAPRVAAPARAALMPAASSTLAEVDSSWHALPARQAASPRRLDAEVAMESVVGPEPLRRMASLSLAPIILHPAAADASTPSVRPTPPPGNLAYVHPEPKDFAIEPRTGALPGVALRANAGDALGGQSPGPMLPLGSRLGPRRTDLPVEGFSGSGLMVAGGAGTALAGLRRAASGLALPGTTADQPAGAPADTAQPAPGTSGSGRPASQGRSTLEADLAGSLAGPSRQRARPDRMVFTLPPAGLDAAPGGTNLGMGGDQPRPSPLPPRRGFAEGASAEGAIGDRPPLARTPPLLSLEGGVSDQPKPAFHARQPSQRAARARAYGTQQWEQAVERGIEFLIRHQFPDGHWSLDRSPHDTQPGYGDAAWGEMNGDTAATGLALLALLGAGYTHLDGKYQEPVGRGLQWLTQNQQEGGSLFTPQTDRTRFAQLYGHGMASIALCEAYGMTGDRQLRGPAQRAVNFILACQHPELGGWRYVPQLESDTSVSGWMLMALKSAQMAGLEVPAEALHKVSRWLDLAQAAGGSQYRYNPYAADTPEQREGRRPNLAMTAEGLLMRMYVGWPQNHPPLVQGARLLQANLPALGTPGQPTRDSYYWYYATQVMFQMQGEFWTAWHRRLGPLLAESQVPSGPLAGSWHPWQPVADRWAREGGRLYVTTLNLLMLEVPYRHLPLYGELLR